MTWNFAMQGIDHIINSAAKTLYMSGGQVKSPIVFRGPNGAAARVAAQHSQDYSSWYAHCPGLIVIAPYSAADAKGLLKSAIRNDSPVLILENEILYGRSFDDVPTDPEHVVPIGRARIARAGAHVTITAYSRMVEVAMEAAQTLAGEGIEAEVIDLRTLRPLDRATIVASVKKTNRIVSVEEGWPYAGIGSELAAVMMEEAFDWLDAPLARVSGADVPMPYAANLEALALPRPEVVVEAAKSVLYAG
jgi:pyruvate dehydrogenase E1 component beta subunit